MEQDFEQDDVEDLDVDELIDEEEKQSADEFEED